MKQQKYVVKDRQVSIKSRLRRLGKYHRTKDLLPFGKLNGKDIYIICPGSAGQSPARVVERLLRNGELTQRLESTQLILAAIAALEEKFDIGRSIDGVTPLIVKELELMGLALDRGTVLDRLRDVKETIERKREPS